MPPDRHERAAPAGRGDRRKIRRRLQVGGLPGLHADAFHPSPDRQAARRGLTRRPCREEPKPSAGSPASRTKRAEPRLALFVARQIALRTEPFASVHFDTLCEGTKIAFPHHPGTDGSSNSSKWGLSC